MARLETLLSATALCALAACGGGGGSDGAGTEPIAVGEPAPPWTWTGIQEASPNRVKVMPLGDSITLGAGSIGGYRLPLYLQLVAEGITSIGLVGTQSSNWPTSVPFTYHEGRGGWTLADLLDFDDGGFTPSTSIESILEASKPGIVLLHAGTNDAFEPATWQLASARLGELLDRIEAWNPKTTTIVAQLIPTGDPAANLCIDWINARAAEIVSERAEAGSNVQLVDMSAVCPTFTSGDGTPVHPDLFCYLNMADAWLTSIKSLKSPVPAPEPLDQIVPGVVAVASSLSDGYLPDLAISAVGIENGLHATEKASPLGWRSAAFEQVFGADGTSVPVEEGPSFELRLPTSVDLSTLSIWNGRVFEATPGSFESAENIRRVQVETLGDDLQWVDRGEIELAPAPARSLAPPQRIAVDWPNTRRVRLTVTEIWSKATAESGVVVAPIALAEVELRGQLP